VALLKIFAVSAVFFFITRWLRRALSGERSLSPSGKPWWDNDSHRTDESRRADDKPTLTTLNFQRDPYEVLGLEKGASRTLVDEARTAMLSQNSPEAVEGMSDDIQALARRNTDEIEDAYAAVTEDET
jgi:hypothetical protein